MIWVVSLSTMKLSPHRLTHGSMILVFAVCLRLVTSTWPELMQSSTSRTPYPWLHHNAFRGEPAISMFGWNFSSIHSSSPSFATLVGSSLDGLSHPLHSGHG